MSLSIILAFVAAPQCILNMRLKQLTGLCIDKTSYVLGFEQQQK